MKYTITQWTIKKLYSIFNEGKLNLSPPYQRNFIWSIDDQQTLIDSINRNIPIPNFFILDKGQGQYEMVDGQQRSRTIIGFINMGYEDSHGKKYSKENHPALMAFSFPVTIIHDVEGESIEKFYALVNKTGVHLNKPEVRKADFYDTNFLKLINDVTSSSKFNSLKLFTDKSLKRMSNIEFGSELIVLIKDGHVDKKGTLDDYFKSDLRKDECAALKIEFGIIIEKISRLNKIFPLSKSRYKQRNDFYTLFDFILNNPDLTENTLIYFYKLLILISKDIKPTQDDCEPLKEYARNCVTQSNSKSARENRLKFFNHLLLNNGTNPNSTQKAILNFYELGHKNIKIVQGYLTIDIKVLNDLKKIEFLQ